MTQEARLLVSFDQKSASVFASPQGIDLGLAVPVIAGEAQERFEIAKGRYDKVQEFHILRNQEWMLGACVQPAHFPLQNDMESLYARMLDVCRGWSLYRIWNFVPRINATTDGLENYRSFSIGRSKAFESCFGLGFVKQLPSASAVGVESDQFACYFLAGKHPSRHVENPEQVSAFNYPSQYGPRPPSFARGTLVETTQTSSVFLSGTASIKGHQTVALDNLKMQFETTVENICLVFKEMGLSGGVRPSPAAERRYKVYIRHRDQASRVMDLCRGIFQQGDRVSYLRADICRDDLLLEIEGSAFGVSGDRAPEH